jgi:hypothetical protein
MDLVISIKDSRLVTWVYEKDLDLYLYLPPKSLHSKGVSTGLVFGQVLLYRHLSTYQSNADKKIKLMSFNNVSWLEATPKTNCFFSSNGRKKIPPTTWLGWKLTISTAERCRRRKQSHVSASTSLTTQMSSRIQQLWRNNVARRVGETPLPKCVNYMNEEVGFEKLVVAYHRPTNLGNLFSIRNIHGRGREVSSYLAK